MKKNLFLFVFALITISVFAQEKPLSPPATAEGTIDGAKITINYSAPSARGRKMVGGIDPYGKVWRTGANAATTFEVSKNVKIEDKDLPAGKYALFTIPGETEWVIIFSKNAKQGGAFDYTDKEDALRVTVKSAKAPAFVETFKIAVEKDKVSLTWENFLVSFKVAKG
jgi:hypothetical protein